MNTKTLLSLCAVLCVSLGACREQRSSTVPPATASEFAATSELGSAELYDAATAPHFDQDGYYELTEVIVPPVGTAPDAPVRFEIDLKIDPALATACGLPKSMVGLETGATVIRARTADKLVTLARCLNEDPLRGDLLKITGHTDPRGSEAYEDPKGLEHANAVAAVLEYHGVPDTRINTYTKGEAMASTDPEDWEHDRRVVIALAD